MLGVHVHRSVSGPAEVARLVGAVADAIVAAVCRRLEGVALKPGAEQAVAACARASRAMAVVSSSPESVIRHALASTGLDRSFDAVFLAEDDEHGKPHPAAYLRAAAALGASPDECIVIEDSLNGVLAGVSAQMTVVAVPEAADRCDPRYAIATLVLDSLKDLDTSVFGAYVSGGAGTPRGHHVLWILNRSANRIVLYDALDRGCGPSLVKTEPGYVVTDDSQSFHPLFGDHVEPRHGGWR
ncbi:HAD family hydrolase [Streptomyces erythrochromogenes]|uniref:HAD family hydrolase n=1 Tax=Streptomyces erythrochromogenes TaxID=285574 RepID=UPI0036BA9FBA